MRTVYQDMHVTNSWEFTEPMAVKAIYKLFTEGDYAVNHRIIVPDKYFYIYTMEGVGTFVVDDDQLVVSANSLVVVNAKRGLHYHCSGPKWNFWLVEFKTAHPRLIPNKVYPLALGKTVLSQFAVALQEFKQEHIQSAAALFQFIYYARPAGGGAAGEADPAAAECGAGVYAGKPPQFLGGGAVPLFKRGGADPAQYFYAQAEYLPQKVF